MNSTKHAVAFPYTSQEMHALFGYAHREDVEVGGRYDARSAVIQVWSHHWLHPATRWDSDLIGGFYVRWDTVTLWQVECEEGFSLDALLIELGRLEQGALGYLRYGVGEDR